VLGCCDVLCTMSNAHWQQTCGRITSRQRDEHLTTKMGLQPAIDDLAHHSAKVSTSTEYLEHVRARLRTMNLLRTRMNATAPRRWAFDHYHSEQLAARTLSKDLVSGCGENVLIVWGNGGFGPTSRGHAAAPNKRLRRLLSKWVPIGAYRTLIGETEYRMCYGVYICLVIRAKLGGRNYSRWYLKKTAFGT